MSSDNPYGPAQPGPWGQGPASGPPPHGYPTPPASPAQPPGATDAGYAFGPFAPPPTPEPQPTAPGPYAAPPPRGRSRGLIVLGVIALALVLVGVMTAVLVRSRSAAAPSPSPIQTSAGGPAPSATPSAPPAGSLASDAVAGYLNALAAGDADRALAYAVGSVPAGPFMTDKVLAESVKRAPITQINVPEVSDPLASTVTASYRIGKTPVTVNYGVQQVGGAWKLTAVYKTLDLGLVRIPSIPILLNGVKVTSDFVDVLPGSYAFTTESPLLTLGSKAVMVIRHPNDYANVLDLRVGLSDAGRKTVVNLARQRYNACLKTRVPRPANCPFSWTNPQYRFRANAARWRQVGADPFAKPEVTVLERSARVTIPLRVRISGPCTFNGTSGTCTGNVTGTGVAAVQLDQKQLKAVWLV
jgi:hypothetical protein